MKDDEILILIQYRIKQAEGSVEAIRKLPDAGGQAIRESVEAFISRRGAHANGIKVSRMRMAGFEADGRSLMGEKWEWRNFVAMKKILVATVGGSSLLCDQCGEAWIEDSMAERLE